MGNYLYMGIMNDLSYMIEMNQQYIEHQSTEGPNTPFRLLGYVTRGLDRYVAEHNLTEKIFGNKLVILPTPHCVVLYNGAAETVEHKIMRLSDSFAHPDGCLELKVEFYSIKGNHNMELKNRCEPLAGYAILTDEVRRLRGEGKELSEAIETAVQDCIERNILADVLRAHRAEVQGMLFEEYDEEKMREIIGNNRYEEGREEGIEEGRLKLLKSMINALGEERLLHGSEFQAMRITPEEIAKAKLLPVS